MTLLVGQLQKSWDDEIAAQDRAIASANAGTDAAGALRRRVDADIASLRRSVNGPESPQEARAAVQAEIDSVNARRDAVIASRNALKVDNTREYEAARKQFEDERRILEGVLDRLQLKQGLAGAAAAVTNKPAAAPPGMKAPVADGDTLEDWKQRAYDRAAAEQKAQEKLAADRYELAISAAQKRTEAENAIEVAAAEKTLEQKRKAEADFVNWQIETAERAQQEREQIAARDAQMYTGLITTAAATIAQGIADGVGGQEDALATTLSALSRQAGGFITLKGGELVAAGIASEFLAPGNPLGLAQIAGGVGLVAAGAAVTAGGPAAVQSLLGSRGGTGGNNTEAARSTGASSSRSSSSSGAPSSTVINITYGGATGRVAEDVAKDVEKSQRKNTKRGRA